jgi:ABC-type multidrug transport system ATPase subunit
LDIVRYDLELNDSAARNMLAAYKFRGNDVFKSAGDLSGGERTRLSLCLLMQQDVNMLILDEPTNHLDIASREWVEECVENFDGTILFVSHDRYFISRFAQKIWDLEEGKISVFNCNYEEYRELKSETEKTLVEKQEHKVKPKLQNKRPKDNTEQKAKQNIKLENDISELEEKIKAVEMELEEAGSDYLKLQELLKEKEDLEAGLEQLYEKWIE